MAADDADVPAQTEAFEARAADSAGPVHEVASAAEDQAGHRHDCSRVSGACGTGRRHYPRRTLINVDRELFLRPVRHVHASVIAGPPVVPPNSNMRVGRSTLQIDCGDGYTADADWYVPTSQEPPKGTDLPSARDPCRQCQLLRRHRRRVGGVRRTASSSRPPSRRTSFRLRFVISLIGDPMHFAIAKLFSGDRAALNASLDAAFEGEDIALPQKYVLVGHSGGSQLAAGVAGYASKLAGPNGSPDLAGVILFDTNDIGLDACRAASRRCR